MTKENQRDKERPGRGRSVSQRRRNPATNKGQIDRTKAGAENQPDPNSKEGMERQIKGDRKTRSQRYHRLAHESRGSGGPKKFSN